MADLGGAILAYMAWKENTKGQSLHPIDGLTPEQRFFVGYSQYYCANVRDEVKRMRAMTSFSCRIPRQRRGLQHAGIPGSVSLQGGPPNGE